MFPCAARPELTSFKEPAVHELFESCLFRTDTDEGHAVLSQVLVQLADLRRGPATDLAAEAAQEKYHCRLISPQRAELHMLRREHERTTTYS